MLLPLNDPSIKIMRSSADAAALFPNAQQLPVSPLLFQPLLGSSVPQGYKWYSPFLDAPPECDPLSSSSSSSSSSYSSSAGCFAPCMTAGPWTWESIDPDDLYEPGVEIMVDPLPPVICPGDEITINVFAYFIPVDDPLYGVPLTISWEADIIGGNMCVTPISYSPALGETGVYDYPPSIGEFGFSIFWGLTGGIYDPPHPKANNFSITIRFEGCCNGNIVIYGNDQDRWLVAPITCCPNPPQLEYRLGNPGGTWASPQLSDPPEDCISLSGPGWVSPFLADAPECSSSSSSSSSSGNDQPDCVGGVTVVLPGTGYQSGGPLWDITSSSYDMATGNWTVSAVANINAGTAPSCAANVSCAVQANAAANPTITSCTSGIRCQGDTVTITGTSTPPTAGNCASWAIQAVAGNITFLTFGFSCTECV